MIHQCPVAQDIPSLNALVVYSSTHLPCAEGLGNAQPQVIHNNAELSQVMQEMNEAARNFAEWDAVVDSITANSHD